MRLRTTLLAASLLACFSAAHAAPAAARVPLSAFVQEDQFTNPVLSPDGKHVAITVRVPNGERHIPVLMFYSLPDLKESGAVRMPAFETPIEYHWVSNSRVIISKGRELGSREKPSFLGEVLATDFDGSKQEYLFGYNNFYASRRGDRYGADRAWGRIESLPRELNNHFYLTAHGYDGNHSMLYDIDSKSGIRKLLADVPARQMQFILQNDGTPRFAYGVGDDSYALLYRYDKDKDNWSRVTDSKGRRYAPELFRPDDSSFLAIYSPNGGPDEVIEETLATGQRKVLFADKVAGITQLEPGSRRGLPLGVAPPVGVPRVQYFDPASEDAKLHKSLSAAFPDSVVHFINFTEDGNTLLFKVASDRDPGSFYLYNRKTAKADLLFTSMADIEPTEMQAQKPVSFKARDGITLYGYLTMPAHAAGKKSPLVILPHGGPHGIADSWYFDTDAQFLASRGYAVLQVNYRGSGGRGVNFETAGYRHWGGKIQDDLVDGIKWTIAQGDVDGARVCAYGASFGGYSALMLAAREPELIKCAVGYAGVYDLNLLAKEERAQKYDSTANTIKRYVGTDKAELDSFSPVMLAAQIKAPVLLVHGEKDKTAPIEHAEAMRAALIKVNRPPEWMAAKNEAHGFYDTANRQRFYELLEAFLDKHIGH